jgi:hypothetical protein
VRFRAQYRDLREFGVRIPRRPIRSRERRKRNGPRRIALLGCGGPGREEPVEKCPKQTEAHCVVSAILRDEESEVTIWNERDEIAVSRQIAGADYHPLAI